MPQCSRAIRLEHGSIRIKQVAGLRPPGFPYVLYVLISGSGGTVDVDLSALASDGSCTLWHWSSTVNDESVGYPALSGGHVVSDAPNGAALVKCTGGGPMPTDTPPPLTDTPPPPTDTPASEPGDAMHVSDISFSTRQQGPWHKVTAIVTIVDTGGAPMDTATVYGSYSGLVNKSVNASTRRRRCGDHA